MLPASSRPIRRLWRRHRRRRFVDAGVLRDLRAPPLACPPFPIVAPCFPTTPAASRQLCVGSNVLRAFALRYGVYSKIEYKDIRLQTPLAGCPQGLPLPRSWSSSISRPAPTPSSFPAPALGLLAKAPRTRHVQHGLRQATALLLRRQTSSVVSLSPPSRLSHPLRLPSGRPCSGVQLSSMSSTRPITSADPRRPCRPSSFSSFRLSSEQHPEALHWLNNDTFAITSNDAIARSALLPAWEFRSCVGPPLFVCTSGRFDQVGA